jgi:hypothetical protein
MRWKRDIVFTLTLMKKVSFQENLLVTTTRAVPAAGGCSVSVIGIRSKDVATALAPSKAR